MRPDDPEGAVRARISERGWKRATGRRKGNVATVKDDPDTGRNWKIQASETTNKERTDAGGKPAFCGWIRSDFDRNLIRPLK